MARSFWDPNWERESTLVPLRPPSSKEEAEALLQRIRDSGYGVPDETFAPCEDRDGRVHIATVGPEHALLVLNSKRDETAALQETVGRLTYYFICTRPRIRAIPERTTIGDDTAEVIFEVRRPDGSCKEFTSGPQPTNGATEFRFKRGGEVVMPCFPGHDPQEQHAALLAQMFCAHDPFQESCLDLEVHYIGRARGELKNRCALDRLTGHDKYQQVLEEVQDDDHPHRTVWLLLASGTTFHSTFSGDPNDRARADVEDREVRRKMTENLRVDLTEALLINYFKPRLNKQHKNALDLGGQTFKACRKAGLTGADLWFDTKHFGVAVTSEGQPDGKLTHAKRYCFY